MSNRTKTPNKTGIAIQVPIITIANKKIKAKGTSIKATNVAEAKNSRICSNSFKVFAKAPTDPFLDLYCKSITCANKRSANARSESIPAALRKWLRILRIT